MLRSPFTCKRCFSFGSAFTDMGHVRCVRYRGDTKDAATLKWVTPPEQANTYTIIGTSVVRYWPYWWQQEVAVLWLMRKQVRLSTPKLRLMAIEGSPAVGALAFAFAYGSQPGLRQRDPLGLRRRVR